MKGHSGDRWNDVADRLAVAAVAAPSRSGRWHEPPTEEHLGEADERRRSVGRVASWRSRGRRPERGRPGRRAWRDPRCGGSPDPRVPAGHLLVVAGLRRRSGRVERAAVAETLAGVIEAQAETAPRPGGAERTAVRAPRSWGVGRAVDAGVPVVVVLPYPDPTAGLARVRAGRIRALPWPSAREVVVLEKKRPDDLEGRAQGAGTARRLAARRQPTWPW